MEEKEKELYYKMWAVLDNARDFAYVLEDKEAIEVLSKLRKKYLNLSGVGEKVIKQLNEELSKA